MSNWLHELPEHRFHALMKRRRITMKKLQAARARGALRDVAQLEYAEDRFGEMKQAQRHRAAHSPQLSKPENKK